MNRSALQAGRSSSGFQPTPIAKHVLQRKCACGNDTAAGGECTECAKKKNNLQRKLQIGAVNDPLEREADRVAEQVLRGPIENLLGSSSPNIQRLGNSGGDFEGDIPESVTRALDGSGTPLDAALRHDMESRFGHDFSGVRVHQGALAHQSARDVNARAYTVGKDVVFGEGEYTTHSSAGQRLIAHELTHVIQQTAMVPNHPVPAGQATVSTAHSAGGQRLQRGPAIVGMDEAGPKANLTEDNFKKGKNELDEKAKKIIASAEDGAKSLDQRAIDAVWNIVRSYYDSSMVKDVVYDEKEAGLSTSPAGEGKNIKGHITVGKYFVENVDSFARRVLQVGHELQHVEQQRSGMGGQNKRNEREFLAHHWTSFEDEKIGTGRMPHSTRVSMIDEALRNYYCMPDDRRTALEYKKDQLIKLRESEEAASGNPHAEPPKGCEKK
jgi:hypothetical protein